MSILAAIYRSPKEEGLYLYVDNTEELSRVPEQLLQQFGKPALAMTLLLDSNRKLANADVTKVLLAIKEHGFYLQLPPFRESLLK